MDDSGAHVVVAMRPAMRVLVLGELDGVYLAAAIEQHAGREGVRLRDFADGFEIAVSVRHGEDLTRAVAAQRLDRHVIRTERFACGREPKARRHAVLEYFEFYGADAGLQVAGFIMIVPGIRVGVAMRVTMGMAVIVAAAAQEDHAGDIDD